MSESLTGASTDQAASIEPTAAPVEQATAETQNQETVPNQSVSETTAPAEAQQQTQTPQTAEAEKPVESTDDGLAKFAKSQGFDPETLTDGERKALKIAHDNQKAYRSNTSKAKVTESVAKVDNDISPDDLQSFRDEFIEYKAAKRAESFFSEDGRDDNLAPIMSEILEEKKLEHGADYARILAQDLPLLYDLARVREPAQQTIDPEAIRREERESINRQLAQSNSPAQAAQTNTMGNQGFKVTTEWINSEYDVKNPEHRQLVDQFFAGQ